MQSLVNWFGHSIPKDCVHSGLLRFINALQNGINASEFNMIFMECDTMNVCKYHHSSPAETIPSIYCIVFYLFSVMHATRYFHHQPTSNVYFLSNFAINFRSIRFFNSIRSVSTVWLSVLLFCHRQAPNFTMHKLRKLFELLHCLFSHSILTCSHCFRCCCCFFSLSF